MMKKNFRHVLVLVSLMALIITGPAPAFAEGPSVKAKFKTEKVNLNTASVEELSTIPGIGTKKAEAIVEYRNAEGAFASAEELLKIKGIGEKLLDKIRPRVEVQMLGSDLPGKTK